MKTLNKYAYDYLIKLINDKDLLSIKAYSEGLGFDTNSYSSPVHYCDLTKQLTVTYRRVNKYYSL